MDREKIVELGEFINKSLFDGSAKTNPAFDEGVILFTQQVLALLKKQPEIVRCKDCRYGQYCTDGETTYQCYKWNSNEFGALHEQDWFCADGGKKVK